jgi:hypothetical protein
VRIRLFDPAAHPRFDDLPWATPLEQWVHPRLTDLPVGLHRHIVRFVQYDNQFYALKELPKRLAEREYGLLRTMNDRGLPVVAAVALVDERGGPDPVLITRYLHYALPFRLLFDERLDNEANIDPQLDPHLDPAATLVESIATLLARLHTAGFYWGDCSLSNALFRRDELHLSAYALDTETGELHEQMTRGQRQTDVEVAVVNVAGGLADLAAAGQLPDSVDPFEVAPQIGTTYDKIWEELHGSSTYDSQDPAALATRLDRLHDLGFGVSEAIITDATESGSFVFRPSTIVGGYHRRELVELTGIVAREHQAHRLLDDISRFRAELEVDAGGRLPLRQVGHRWLTEWYDSVLAAVPSDVAGKLERPQLYIEVLDHQELHPTGEKNRRVALLDAARRYANDVLARRPHERVSATWADTDS